MRIIRRYLGATTQTLQAGKTERERLAKIFTDAKARPSRIINVHAPLQAFRVLMLSGLPIAHILDRNAGRVYLGIMEGLINLISLHDELGEVVRGGIQIKLFSRSEARKLNKLLPLFELEAGELVSPFHIAIPVKAPSSWDKGMSSYDAQKYKRAVYPVFIDELERNPLSPASLVVEPACCDGSLLEQVSNSFPQYRLMGSDLNEVVFERARKRNPLIKIEHSDAKRLDYLSDESVDLFLCSGLLGIQVVDKEGAWQILLNLREKLKPKGRIFIYGQSYPLLFKEDYERAAFKIIKCCKWNPGSGFFVGFYVLEKL